MKKKKRPTTLTFTLWNSVLQKNEEKEKSDYKNEYHTLGQEQIKPLF